MEALNTQVDATKEVLDITKDMLNLRNIESDHQQSRLDAMILKLSTERDRRLLMEKRLEASKQMEVALRKEYEVQSGIFKVSVSFWVEMHNALRGINFALNNWNYRLPGSEGLI